MALITTIAEVKAVMRISNLDLDGSLPDIEAAQESRLQPYLGADFIFDLQAAKDTPAGTEEEPVEQPTALMLQLLAKAQKALAYFAYHDDLGNIHARLTDAGVRRNTTDGMPAAFRWEYEALKESLIEKAYQALESLLLLMEQNSLQDELATWLSSDGYTRRNKYLIKSPLDFDDRYSIYQPFRSYHLLQSCMADVEKLYVYGCIGKTFYAILSALAEPSDIEKEAIELLKDAIVNLSISQAFKKLPVRITDKGLTVFQGGGDGKDADRGSAPETYATQVENTAEANGYAYLAQLKKLLNTNASASVFPDYYASDLYTAISTEPYDRGNSGRRIYGF